MRDQNWVKISTGELVAEAANRQNDSGLLGILFELLPQKIDVLLDVFEGGKALILPEFV